MSYSILFTFTPSDYPIEKFFNANLRKSNKANIHVAIHNAGTTIPCLLVQNIQTHSESIQNCGESS